MRSSLPLALLLFALAVFVAGPCAAITAQETEGAALAASFHLDDASLPDPTRSPGDTSKDAVVDDLCDSPIEDFAKTPPKALCDDLFVEAGASEASRFQYACVFVVPPSIGGSQSIANVWLQPVAEARLKERADAAVRKHVCRNPAELAEVQRLMANNWVSAYRKYLLPGDQLVPDAFSTALPALADVVPAASCGGAGGSSQANVGDDAASSSQNDRRRRLRGFGQDGRRGGDGSGADAQGGQRRQEAARGSYGRGGFGRHTEASNDGARARDGRDMGSRAGGPDGDHHPAAPREVDSRQSFADERGVGGPDRSPAIPPRNQDGRGFGSNHSFEPGDSRVSPPRYAQGQDIRPNDVRPTDVRPNDVRPNDVRPSRPGLGMPRYPSHMPRAGHRRRRRR